MFPNSSTFLKNNISLVFILALILFTCFTARTEELSRGFVAGMPKNFPPHFFIDSDTGKPKGFGVDVMDAVAKRTNIQIEYKSFENWKETNLAAKEGLIDIIPNMGFISERRSFMDFTPPYETFRINFYKRVTSPIKTAADIKNRTVGVVITNKARFILEKKGQYNLVKVNSSEDLVWKLIAGDVDCVAMPEPVMSQLIRKAGLTDHIQALGEPLVEIKRGIAVSKGREELLQLLRSTMDEFLLSQDFKDIYTKWYGQPEPYWTARNIIIACALVLTLTFFGISIWRYRFITKTNKELEITLLDRTKKIEESERRYKQMFLDNQAVKLVIDPADGKIVEANDAACEFYHYSKDEILSMNIADINTLSLKQIQAEMDSAAAQNRGQFYFSHKLANGEIRDVEVYSGPIDVGGKPLLFSIIHDISKRKQAEDQLKKSEERFRVLFDNAPLPYQSLDEDGYFIEVNKKWLDVLGYSREEVVGQNFADFLHPDWINHFKENFPKFKSIGEVLGVEFEFRKKDGTFIWIKFDGKIRTDGKGDFIQTHCVFRDITEQRRLEKKIAEQEQALRHSQKMESVGNLAGGIAHEFNNLLSIIIGNNELIAEELPSWNVAREYSEEIRIAGMRARDVIKQLLTFSRRDNSAKKVINIKSVVDESVRLVRSSTPTNIEIKYNFSDDFFSILCDATQINQVLINLCNNSIHAMTDPGGLLSIDLSKETVTHGQYSSLQSGQYVKLTVTDNGAGMDKDTLDRIFDPFFTTKEVDIGTGIGLAVVYGIIERHDGYIVLESQPGEGTTFTIFFPLHDGPSEDEDNTLTDLPKGDEHILYIDDEPSIATLGKRHLESLGYTAESTTDPRKALEMIKLNPDKFDLVISDMAMPKMTGDQLITEILKTRPDMPTIICTGYSAKISETEAESIGASSFVLKPVSKVELAQTIRKILDKSNSTTNK